MPQNISENETRNIEKRFSFRFIILIVFYPFMRLCMTF